MIYSFEKDKMRFFPHCAQIPTAWPEWREIRV